MNAYWVKFSGHGPGCIEAENQAAATKLAEDLTGANVTEASVLPYPANPRLNAHRHEKYGACPSFCYTPELCKGRTSCPKPHACDD